MKNRIEHQIAALFERIEIRPVYAERPVKIEAYQWEGDKSDLLVRYRIQEEMYVFHYNRQLAKEMGEEYLQIDVLEQLEKEVKYMKRMYERGIGAKEYLPFTSQAE